MKCVLQKNVYSLSLGYGFDLDKKKNPSSLFLLFRSLISLFIFLLDLTISEKSVLKVLITIVNVSIDLCNSASCFLQLYIL